MKISDLTDKELFAAAIMDESEKIGPYTLNVMKPFLTQKDMKEAKENTIISNNQ